MTTTPPANSTLEPHSSHGESPFAWPHPLSPDRVSERFLSRVPLDFARDRLVISQGVNDDGAEILCVDSDASENVAATLAHNIGVRLERAVTHWSAPGPEIAQALDALARRRGGDVEHAESISDGGVDERDLAAAIEAESHDLVSTSGRAPIVKLINGLLFEALQRRASDLHVEPRADELVIRYRIDGVLRRARTLPRKLLEPMVSRIKVMARLDIAERRLPQDGRATVTIGASEIDLRISSIPTAQGERVVIRLLDKSRTAFFSLDTLGMPDEVETKFDQLCRRPNGLILVTGPTGAGKTTTLYSVLRRLDAESVNIMTIEDPIEYELPGISQSQVNLRKGITFVSGLRHILRQDPDVIMVGEIRDAETASIAVQSAMTGHVVFSTLHTNDAPGAVARLLDLGVAPYLVNESLAGVLAQRLVRRRCESCSSRTIHDADAACPTCEGTGFHGRLGIFELLIIDSDLKALISEGGDVATGARISEIARRKGMQTLREAGQAAVIAGLTTRQEVDRVTLASDLLEVVAHAARDVS